MEQAIKEMVPSSSNTDLRYKVLIMVVRWSDSAPQSGVMELQIHTTVIIDLSGGASLHTHAFKNKHVESIFAVTEKYI